MLNKSTQRSTITTTCEIINSSCYYTLTLYENIRLVFMIVSARNNRPYHQDIKNYMNVYNVVG